MPVGRAMMSNRLLSTLAIMMCMLFLVSAFAGTVSATQFNEWQGVRSLEGFTAGSNSTSPVADFDQLGRGVAAWNWEFRGAVHVRASFYDPETGWSEPVVLDQNGVASAPVVAVDEIGNAVVAWTQNEEGGLAVYGSGRALEGSWDMPAQLTVRTYDDVIGLTAVANNVNQLMVVFAGYDGNGSSILVSNYRTQFGFDAQASVIVNLADRVTSLSADSNGKSNIWVVWDRFNSGDHMVEGIKYDIVNWSPYPFTLAGPGAVDPWVAVDSMGRATLVYQVNETGRAVLETKRYQNYLWYEGTTLYDQEGSIAQMKMVMNPSGNITVAMLVNDPTPRLMVADFNGTVWKSFAPILGTSGPMNGLDVAIDAAGDAMVVYGVQPSDSTVPYAIYYALREEGGNWTTANKIDAVGSGPLRPGHQLVATRADYWLVFPRTEIGTTGESRVWADQYFGLQRAGARLTPYFYGLNGTVSTSLVEVAGWIDPYSSVTVNDQTVTADQYGHFSAFIPLKRGNNPIDLTTVDSLGRSAHVTIYVNYDPNAATVSGLLVTGLGAAVLAAVVGVLYLFLRRR